MADETTEMPNPDHGAKLRGRERLRKLRAQRSAGPGQLPQSHRSEERDREPGGLGALSQHRALKRAYRVLTETPADEQGMVDGTPFTRTGVARLVEALRSRAANEGAGGAKAAAGILKFLSPSDDKAEQVHSVSVEKLQRVAKMGLNGGGRGPSRA